MSIGHLSVCNALSFHIGGARATGVCTGICTWAVTYLGVKLTVTSIGRVMVVGDQYPINNHMNLLCLKS